MASLQTNSGIERAAGRGAAAAAPRVTIASAALGAQGRTSISCSGSSSSGSSGTGGAGCRCHASTHAAPRAVQQVRPPAAHGGAPRPLNWLPLRRRPSAGSPEAAVKTAIATLGIWLPPRGVRLRCTAASPAGGASSGASGSSSSSSSGSGSGGTSSSASASSSGPGPAATSSQDGLPDNFCIIDDYGGIKEFDKYDLQEISKSIQARRSRIFLLMEEVRRLRIEQRNKGGDLPLSKELKEEKFSSALPFLPPLDETTLNLYFTVYGVIVISVILFGGLVAPLVEIRLGLGGMSYLQFVESMHLPSQLAQVDPIVASFCGGAVGVLSSALLIEYNNVMRQIANRCHYCKGTGYLMCGNCIGCGTDPETKGSCVYCMKSGKVMCTGCLCTGKSLATEHDPRIDPFD